MNLIIVTNKVLLFNFRAACPELVEGSHTCTFYYLFSDPIVSIQLMLNRELELDVIEQKIDHRWEVPLPLQMEREVEGEVKKNNKPKTNNQ